MIFATKLPNRLSVLQVVDKELRNWILPDFSTTTENDTIVSAVMMMSTLKAYVRQLAVLHFMLIQLFGQLFFL